MIIEKCGSGNDIMKREALMGHYAIRCFDWFGEGEDAIIVYPNFHRIEKFCENNKGLQDLFEVLIGAEFDLGIEDAVLVGFEGDDRKIIASKKAIIKRANERGMVIDIRN